MMQLAQRSSLRGFGALPMRARHRLRGFGDATETQYTQVATSVASPIASAALAPSVAATLGIGVSAAIPIIGAAVAAVGFAIEAILNSGCGQTCVETSQWANEAEPLLQQNIQAYFNIPAPRPQSVQAAAVAQFMTVWNELYQQCSQPNLGTAGQNCIGDRESGACHYHQTTTPPWGSPVAGACWNWWSGYHDPIANDPNVISDEEYQAQQTTASGATSTISSGSTSPATSSFSSSTFLLLGGAALLLLAGMGGSN